MQLFSTIVFIDGIPIGYKVYEDRKNQYLLSPAESPGRTHHPPVLTASHVNGQWKVEGTDNQSIVEQVIQDLNQNKSLLSTSLSAAP